MHLRLIYLKGAIVFLAGAKNGQKVLARKIKMVDVPQPI
jgi:hypothetical protein